MKKKPWVVLAMPESALNSIMTAMDTGADAGMNDPTQQIFTCRRVRGLTKEEALRRIDNERKTR